MSTQWEDIRTALDTHLEGMGGAPPISFLNLPFTPTVGTLYIRVEALDNTVNQAGLGAGGEDEYRGVYALNVFGPIAFGSKAPMEMGDTIATRFKRGSILTSNSVNVRVINNEVRPGRPSAGWYQVPVNIFFNSFTPPRT